MESPQNVTERPVPAARKACLLYSSLSVVNGLGMIENPYASPTNTEPLRAGRAGPVASGWGRFVLHMVVASILAPAAGAAVYTYCECDWQGAPGLSRLAGSVLGGLLLLFFIWIITVPFGILTYFVCRAATAAGVTSLAAWSAGGAVAGLAFGLFAAAWASLPAGLHATSGSLIGLAAGAALAAIWKSGPHTDPAGSRDP